jgi:exosortase
MENSVKNALSVKPIHIQIGFLLLAFLALYYPFIQTLVRDWDTNDNYSQGYFIPFVSAFMIWWMREELAAVELKPSNWGIALIALGLLQLFISKVGSEYFLQRISMILVLFGTSLFLFGRRWTRVIWLPLVYLIFMIPLPAIIWNRIAFPMQLFASALTEDVVQLIGIPILREGNVLHLAQTSLEVVDACSGLRSLVNILGLAVGLGFLMNKEAWKRWALFLAAFPIAIVVNIIRLSGTAVLASRYGGDMARGFLHDFSGWLVFVAGIGLLLLVQSGLGKMGKERRPAPGAGGTDNKMVN